VQSDKYGSGLVPFSLVQNAFLHESQAPGKGVASGLGDGAMNAYAMQIIIAETFGHDRAGGLRHDSSAFISGIDPIADVGVAIRLVDGMKSEVVGYFENPIA